MIPSIRSIAELRLITQSRYKETKNLQIMDLSSLTEDSGQRKRYLRTEREKKIELPELHKMTKIRKNECRKRKDALHRFIDDLSYDNEIKSSYYLNSIAIERNKSQQDAA